MPGVSLLVSSPMSHSSLKAAFVLLALSFFTFINVNAQPSPKVQARISAAIKKAANEVNPDYTAIVNPFIGTG